MQMRFLSTLLFSFALLLGGSQSDALAQGTIVNLPGLSVEAGAGGTSVVMPGMQVETGGTTAGSTTVVVPGSTTVQTTRRHAVASTAGASYANAELVGMDFRGQNLIGADFSGASLTDTDFSGANLSGANFTNADLTNTNFAGAIMIGTNLTNTSMIRTNLTNTDLSGADLTNATIEQALATGARFDGANMTNVDMTSFIRQGTTTVVVPQPAQVRPAFVDASAISNALVVAPGQQPRRIDLTVNFDFNSDKLTSDGARQVSEIAQALADPKLRGAKIMIEGHTDGVGSDSYNMDLSKRRALRVMRTLNEEHNVSQTLTAVGFGKSRPISSNNSDIGRAMNRRVTLVNMGQ